MRTQSDIQIPVVIEYSRVEWVVHSCIQTSPDGIRTSLHAWMQVTLFYIHMQLKNHRSLPVNTGWRKGWILVGYASYYAQLFLRGDIKNWLVWYLHRRWSETYVGAILCSRSTTPKIITTAQNLSTQGWLPPRISKRLRSRWPDHPASNREFSWLHSRSQVTLASFNPLYQKTHGRDLITGVLILKRGEKQKKTETED